MKFLNCMQHDLSEKQLAEIRSRFFCIEEVKLQEAAKQIFDALKSIKKETSYFDLVRYAQKILDLDYAVMVLPIGNPYFMCVMTEQAIISKKTIKFLFSFSERKAVEKKEGDKVVKTTIFEHKRFDVMKFEGTKEE